jgi:subtilisin family serine protease
MLGHFNAYSEEEGYVDVLIGFTEEADPSEIVEDSADIKYNFTSIDVIAASVPEETLDELATDPNIEFVEFDAPVYALGHSSSNIEYQNSWGVDHIGADLVHADGNKGTAVKICLLDTGIDYNHPDLAANFKGGKDFINSDNDPLDDNGHGSNVAGIAAAVLDGAGVVGVAPEAHLYAGKVLNRFGSGSISDVIAGIEWCVDEHVQIISMSLGSSTGSVAWKNALNAAYSDGVLIVAAAGNSGNCEGTGNNVRYPARYDSVIAVAMTDQNDLRHCKSATGSKVELSAPGVNIKSTSFNGAYFTNSGTSMSAPHVSGSAALIMRTDETIWAPLGYTNGDGVWSNGEVRKVLAKTAQDLGTNGRDPKYGYGLVRPDLVTSEVAASSEEDDFPSFSANVIAAIACDTSDNKLKVKGTFSLDKKNHGVYPLKEHVTMIVGPVEITIPGGSFKSKTDIAFNGEIDNLQIHMKVKKAGNKNDFKFSFVANGLNLSWVDNDPVLVKLNIDDLGQAIVTPTIVDKCI